MKRAIVALIFAIAAMAAPAHADTRPPIGVGSTGNDVTTAQFILRSEGWVLPVDGVFGPRTLKVVKAFQRVNGINQTGIIGPITWGALQSAVRVSPPIPAPAPQSLSGCALAQSLRIDAGLPPVFDIFAKRESNCRNDVTSSTGCCVGLFQIHTGNFTAPGYRAGILACGVTKRSDILGDSIEQWRANTCVAKVLWSVSGLSPWAL